MLPWVFDKNGNPTWIAQELECYAAIPGALSRFKVKKRIGSQIIGAGNAAAAYTSYLDEITVGGDVYVSNGYTSAAGQLALSLYKG